VAETYFSAHHLPCERSNQNREWFDLKALTQYASVSERTVRQWIHRAANPLPAVRVRTKILVRRSAFDLWLEGHRLETIDVGCIVDEMVSDLVGTN
jgi:excisionase family DNA binding protein